MMQRPNVRVVVVAGAVALVLGVLSPAGAKEPPPAQEPAPSQPAPAQPAPAEDGRRSCAAEPPPGALVAGPTHGATLTGTAGDDVIYVTAPGKTVQALAGDDMVCSSWDAGGVIVDGGEGNDYVHLTNSASDVVYGGGGNDRLFATGGDDRLYGDSGNDRLFAGQGNDFVSGGADNDQLRGGAGSDALYGDDGVDHCQGDSEFDSATSCEQSAEVEQTGW